MVRRSLVRHRSTTPKALFVDVLMDASHSSLPMSHWKGMLVGLDECFWRGFLALALGQLLGLVDGVFVGGPIGLGFGCEGALWYPRSRVSSRTCGRFVPLTPRVSPYVRLEMWREWGVLNGGRSMGGPHAHVTWTGGSFPHLWSVTERHFPGCSAEMCSVYCKSQAGRLFPFITAAGQAGP
jgi:hypothetical protein